MSSRCIARHDELSFNTCSGAGVPSGFFNCLATSSEGIVFSLIDLYQWCADRKIDVMTNVLTRPDHLQIRQLPRDIKDGLLTKYQQWKYSMPMPGIGNPRDPTRFREHIDAEIQTVIHCLQQDADPEQSKKLYDAITAWGWFNNPEIKKYFVLEKL
jgi:hypothetical protein